MVVQLIERHEILRTVFVKDGDLVMQRVLSMGEADLELPEVIDLSTWDELEELIRKEYDRVFDLSVFPLFHLQICRLPDGAQQLVAAMHHSIVDGHSGGIIRFELDYFYRTINGSPVQRLTDLPYQYRDFAHWQRRFVESEAGLSDRDFWLEKLKGAKLQIEFPRIERMRSNNPQNGMGIREFLKGKSYSEINKFTRREGVTSASLLRGVLILLCHQLAGQEDITILNPVSCRNSTNYGNLEISGLIGYFVNFLLVRNVVTPEDTLLGFLTREQDNFIHDLSHGDYPIGRLIGELFSSDHADVLKGMAVYNYHNYDYLAQAEHEGTKEEGEQKKPGSDSMEVAVVLAVTEFLDCFRLNFLFNEAIFDKDARKAFVQQYVFVLRQVIREPLASVGELERDSLFRAFTALTS